MNSPAASSTITCCQVCNSKNLDSVLFLGFLPPVNTMPPIGGATEESPFFPAELLQCQDCHLVQLSCVVDAEVLFPSHYPYTSSTTKILRENFAELYQESSQLLSLEKKDLVVDIGSNDGNLLSNFTSHRVLGITPEEIGKIAIERGIPTLIDYFSETLAERVVLDIGLASISLFSD